MWHFPYFFLHWLSKQSCKVGHYEAYGQLKPYDGPTLQSSGTSTVSGTGIEAAGSLFTLGKAPGRLFGATRISFGYMWCRLLGSIGRKQWWWPLSLPCHGPEQHLSALHKASPVCPFHHHHTAEGLALSPVQRDCTAKECFMSHLQRDLCLFWHG